MTLANIEPISAAQWQLAAAQRARVYDWLAALHAREIDDAGLGACFAGTFAPMLDGLAALGLTRECERLRRAIDELRTTALARLELAADFAQLFLLDARHSAPPYASLYDHADPRFCGAAEARMRTCLAGHALALSDSFREPADHLAVYLSFLARLIDDRPERYAPAHAASAQLDFVDEALLPWLPAFAHRCQSARARFDFYPALAALLNAFVRQDARFLRDVTGEAATPAAR